VGTAKNTKIGRDFFGRVLAGQFLVLASGLSFGRARLPPWRVGLLFWAVLRFFRRMVLLGMRMVRPFARAGLPWRLVTGLFVRGFRRNRAAVLLFMRVVGQLMRVALREMRVSVRLRRVGR
jgi:hypothetical protein